MLGMLGCMLVPEIKNSDMSEAGRDWLVSWLPDLVSKAILPVQNPWHVYLEMSFNFPVWEEVYSGNKAFYTFYS